MTIDALLADVAPGLHEVVLRESLGGWQAIAKTRAAVNGPWSVSCGPDPVAALTKALTGAKPAPAAPPAEDIFG